MQRWTLITVLGLALGTVAAASPASRAIVLEPLQPAGDLLEIWTQPGAVPSQLEATLDIGDEAGGRVLRLIAADDTREHRVSVQFETSAAIGGEGPHLDLVDWKHCRSDWRAAPAVGDGGFRLPAPEEHDHSCFPPTTRAELRDAVRQAVRRHDWDPVAERHWLGLAARAATVGEEPSYVAISLIRVRIEQREAGGWRLLTEIELHVPMGC